jgi:hypothetical protein
MAMVAHADRSSTPAEDIHSDSRIVPTPPSFGAGLVEPEQVNLESEAFQLAFTLARDGNAASPMSSSSARVKAAFASGLEAGSKAPAGDRDLIVDRPRGIGEEWIRPVALPRY